jgi:hypothetical protein
MSEKLKFGEPVENVSASDDNPMKSGFFVRYVPRFGGAMAEYTNGMGDFSTTPPDNLQRVPAVPQALGTPAAKWRVLGHTDPHMTRYDCERGHLLMGNLTDDEIANAVYLNNNDLATLTAAKDRIRWLSRQLEAAIERNQQADALSLPRPNEPRPQMSEEAFTEDRPYGQLSAEWPTNEVRSLSAAVERQGGGE